MRWLTFAASLCLLQACQNVQAPRGAADAGPPAGPVEPTAWPWPHRISPQCPLRVAPPGSWLLDSPQAAAQILMMEPQAWLGQPVAWPQVQVLVHALPVQPHLGLRLELAGPPTGPQASARPPVLHLRVRKPAPDAVLPTALGLPCLVLLLPRGAAPNLQVQHEGDASERFTPTLLR